MKAYASNPISQKLSQKPKAKKVHHTRPMARKRLGLKAGESMPPINEMAQQHMEKHRDKQYSPHKSERGQFKKAQQRQHNLFGKHDTIRQKEITRKRDAIANYETAKEETEIYDTKSEELSKEEQELMNRLNNLPKSRRDRILGQ